MNKHSWRALQLSAAFGILALGISGCGAQQETSNVAEPSAEREHIVVYTCFDGIDNEICAVHQDGTNHRQLTNNGFDDQAPSINDAGLIVYQCSTRICVMNSEGKQTKAISDRRTRDVYSPDLNNAGVVVYECKPIAAIRPEICSVDLAVGEEIRVTMNGKNDLAPTINDNNVIAYRCEVDHAFQICVSNADGTEQRQLTDSEISAWYPEINNSNRIAYVCPTSRGQQICAVNADGSNAQILTQERILEPGISINNRGEIAFVCSYDVKEICIVDDDGSDLRRVTDRDANSVTPSISDQGMLAYVCRDDDEEICIVHVDGSRFARITQNNYYDARPALN